MYSRTAGTGFCSASSGSQMRAARWQPSLSLIQAFSISLIFLGNFAMVFIVIVGFYPFCLAPGEAATERRPAISDRSLPAVAIFYRSPQKRAMEGRPVDLREIKRSTPCPAGRWPNRRVHRERKRRGTSPKDWSVEEEGLTRKLAI